MKILTFDIEEWFHIMDNKSTKTEKSWAKYQDRLIVNVERILRFLEFFVFHFLQKQKGIKVCLHFL